jgi:ABC-type transport system substrate-binding protein
VQALRTGQVDMITEMLATAVAALRNDSDITLVVGPPAAPDIADIIFNLVAPGNCPPGDGVCSGHPALRDRNVRLALAHATATTASRAGSPMQARSSSLTCRR